MQLDTGYQIHVITSESSSGPEICVSRIFSPVLLASPSEDPVSGSAHSLLGTYWTRKKGLAANQDLVAKQLSPRGGVLEIFWDEQHSVMRLKGDCHVMAKGELNL